MKAVFWAALALSILVKGPIGPMVVALTLIALGLWDRKIAWLKTLGWGWGAILLLAVLGPWALAITVATDGAFWGAAVGGDLAPKLLGEQEGHGAPPGFHALLLPLLMFPACLLLPAGLIAGWRARTEPAVRFALCWLIPAWLVFELTPTKLVHYTLPLYGALAWLMARALTEPVGTGARWAGAALALLAGLLLAAAGPAAMNGLHDWSGIAWAVAGGRPVPRRGPAGGWLLRRPGRASRRPGRRPGPRRPRRARRRRGAGPASAVALQPGGQGPGGGRRQSRRGGHARSRHGGGLRRAEPGLPHGRGDGTG